MDTNSITSSLYSAMGLPPDGTPPTSTPPQEPPPPDSDTPEQNLDQVFSLLETFFSTILGSSTAHTLVDAMRKYVTTTPHTQGSPDSPSTPPSSGTPGTPDSPSAPPSSGTPGTPDSPSASPSSGSPGMPSSGNSELDRNASQLLHDHELWNAPYAQNGLNYDDMTRAMNDTSLDDKTRAAARYFVRHKSAFAKVDTAGNWVHGASDGVITRGQLQAVLNPDEMWADTPANRDKYGNWLKGPGSGVANQPMTLENFKRMAGDPNLGEQTRMSAQFFVEHPDAIDGVFGAAGGAPAPAAPPGAPAAPPGAPAAPPGAPAAPPGAPAAPPGAPAAPPGAPAAPPGAPAAPPGAPPAAPAAPSGSYDQTESMNYARALYADDKVWAQYPNLKYDDLSKIKDIPGVSQEAVAAANYFIAHRDAFDAADSAGGWTNGQKDNWLSRRQLGAYFDEAGMFADNAGHDAYYAGALQDPNSGVKGPYTPEQLKSIAGDWHYSEDVRIAAQYFVNHPDKIGPVLNAQGTSSGSPGAPAAPAAAPTAPPGAPAAPPGAPAAPPGAPPAAPPPPASASTPPGADTWKWDDYLQRPWDPNELSPNNVADQKWKNGEYDAFRRKSGAHHVNHAIEYTDGTWTGDHDWSYFKDRFEQNDIKVSPNGTWIRIGGDFINRYTNPVGYNKAYQSWNEMQYKSDSSNWGLTEHQQAIWGPNGLANNSPGDGFQELTGDPNLTDKDVRNLVQTDGMAKMGVIAFTVNGTRFTASRLEDPTLYNKVVDLMNSHPELRIN